LPVSYRQGEMFFLSVQGLYIFQAPGCQWRCATVTWRAKRLSITLVMKSAAAAMALGAEML